MPGDGGGGVTADESHKLDCLAAWCLAHPERGRVMWSHWSDPSHRNARAPEWLADMRERFARLKAAADMG